MEKGKNKVFCVISHTHWDREWYMPLENFRHRLTDLMDRLLAALEEQPDYIFHLDAQTVVLEDYLLVRPEKRAILTEIVRNRRIVIGPWYLQNDFYLTSGEATVRNLLEGARLCREFGGSSRVGYAADQFGNPSQLPQILRGFGMESFVFGRGFARYDVTPDGKITPKKTPTEFIWRGGDGSEVLAVHMRHWYNNAQRFSADIAKALGYLKLIEKNYDDEFTLTPYLLLMNGVDHLEAQPDLPEIAEKMQARLPEGQYVLQYCLDDYVEAVDSYLKEHGVTPETVEGELRQSHDVTVLQGTLSSRPYLKIANDEAEILLENQLEPLYAMMEKAGMKGVYPADRLRYTWKNLMRNHPHDSICGCSHDAVHRHMENRFEEIFEFAGEQLRRGLLALGEHTARGKNGDEDEYLITVANTLAFPRRGIVRVTARIPSSDEIASFHLLDKDGKEVDYAVLSKKDAETNVYSPINLPGQVAVTEYDLLLDAGEIAPYAVRTFLLSRGGALAPVVPAETGESLIENEFWTLSLTDGRVVLSSKTGGRTFPDLLAPEDRADTGDSYCFLPGTDAPLTGFRAELVSVRNAGLSASLTLRYALSLPAYYDFAAQKRSDETALSELLVTLTLDRGDPTIRLSFVLKNASKDHRLRLFFRGDVSSDRAAADIPFEIVSHRNEDLYPGASTPTMPASSFAALEKDGKGFAVFTAGAHEMEHPAPETLSFTLVRSTGCISSGGTENWVTPENQCLREIAGRFGVLPYDGTLIDAKIPDAALSFRAPLLAGFSACDTRKFAGGRPCVQDTELQEFFYLPDGYPGVSIPDGESALTVKGEGVTVSAFKKSEDGSGLILRLVNLSDRDTEADVASAGKIFKTRLDEIPRAFLGRDRVRIPMRKKEILTLYLL